jgi:DnaJ-class molecular chaperone
MGVRDVVASITMAWGKRRAGRSPRVCPTCHGAGRTSSEEWTRWAAERDEIGDLGARAGCGVEGTAVSNMLSAHDRRRPREESSVECARCGGTGTI